jgi:hypothetical protein
MVKIGNLLRKGLENLVAPVLIGAGALLGSLQEAKAHTNDPSFYILYAQSDQVNWTNSATLNPANTNIWKQNYTAYAPGYGGYTNNASLNILVGTFINTGTNAPVDSSSKMRSTTYNFNLTDVSMSNKFTVTRAVLATNGVWQNDSFLVKTIDATIDGSGNYGNNVISISSANAVFGNSLSSAIQISLNDLSRSDTLIFQPNYPTSVTYANGDVHAAGAEPDPAVTFLDSGSIMFIPEPSTFALLGAGVPALLWRRRRADEKTNNDLIEAKARQYAESIERRAF